MERPELSRWAMPYREAFTRLSGSRPVSMGGAGAIPLSEILSYCRLYGISDPDEIDDLVYLIGVMDGEWLAGINTSE